MDEKILINWGSYDVDNFGDLLFPLLVNHYLGGAYSKVIHASPTGKRSIWSDALPTCTIANALKYKNICGLIVGGGNLISWTTSSSTNYVEDDRLSRIVHPSFFYVPYILRAKYGIPYVYNYVGVAKPVPLEKQCNIKLTMETASFISCRDKSSAERLRQCGVDLPISVGVDSAIDISKVYSLNYLRDHYNQNIREKYKFPRDKDVAVIHVKQRYLKDQFEELSHLISYLVDHNIHPVFIPFGVCHGDDLLFNDPKFPICTATIIRKPECLVDMLSVIATSSLYIGSSLHGAIVSLSYQNKVILVADELESRFSKFSGFLEQMGIPDCLYNSWRDAYIALKVFGLDTFKTTTPAKVAAINNRERLWQNINDKFLEIKATSVLSNDPFTESICAYYEI